MQKKIEIEKQLGNIQSMKLQLLFTIFSSKLWLLFEGDFYLRNYSHLSTTNKVENTVGTESQVIPSLFYLQNIRNIK